MDARLWIGTSSYKWACIFLVAVPYCLLFFTNAGNFYHGGNLFSQVVLDAFAVIGAYASVELLRSAKAEWIKTVAFFLGVPLFFFIGASLWVAIFRYF